MKKYYFILFSFIFILAGCGDDPTESKAPAGARQPTLRIKVNQENPVIYGDTILVTVEPTDADLVISSVVLSAGDGSKIFAQSENGIFRLSTRTTGGGEVKMKVEASFADGQTSTRYKDLRIISAEAPSSWEFSVVNRYPHDTKSYTQGLLVHKGFIYEGTGNYGESRLRKIELATGKVLQEKHLNDATIFGEGITIYDNKIFQLTYTTSQGYVYDLESFDLIDEFIYNTFTGEGWGLTHNDTALIVSDGSAIIYFFDPKTYKETGRVKVFNNLGEVSRLNELEFHNGKIYANIYTTTEIVAIDPLTGLVTDVYNAKGVVERSEVTSGMDVLNGIAINPLNGNMLITGKYWSKLYEVTPVPKEDI